ncbi:GAF domain-containing protein [Brevibacterium sediminis]
MRGGLESLRRIPENKFAAAGSAIGNLVSTALIGLNSLPEPPSQLAFFVGDLWIVLAFVGLIVSGLYALLTNLFQRDLLNSAARRERKRFAEQLMPAVQAIEDAMSSTKEDHARSLKDRTINFLKDTIDAENVRACFYDLGFKEGPKTDVANTATTVQPQRVLSWDGQIRGRTDPPRHKEYVDDPADKIASENFAALDSGEPRLVENTRKVRIGVELNPEYETFLNTPVHSNGEPIGMLTIDASRRKSINSDDVAVARVGALILGIAISRLKKKNLRTNKPTRTTK